MAKVIPFKALRPRPDVAQVVSSRSYDSNHNHISRAVMADNEYSYLHVVKPHLNFSDPERIPEKHFPIARRKLEAMVAEGILQKEGQPCFYLHQITDNIRHLVYNGIVGLASVDDYLNNHIKKHEHTLTKKEMGLVNHVEYVKAVGEPVLLTFNAGEWYDQLIEYTTNSKPEYDFTSDEGLHHRLWVINNPDETAALSQHMADAGDLYIADGHHRIASAARYCEMQREKDAENTNEACCYFLAYMIPTDKIKVFEFNRLVRNLGGLSEEEFFNLLRNDFDVYEIGPAKLRVKKKNFQFGMYMDDKWYGLDYKPATDKNDVLGGLDVTILEEHILKPILRIQDSKTDDRLSFIDGTKGTSRLQELVDNGDYKVAFSLYPTKIEEVIAVADKGLVMPPKSTWFEPKLRTGLLIHEV